MGSEKIETVKLQPGKWYWHHELDRPVFITYVNEQRKQPYALIPSIGYLNGNGKKGEALAKSSANFYAQSVDMENLGEINANPTTLDF